MFVLVGKFSRCSCWWVGFACVRGGGCVLSVFVLVGGFCHCSYWWLGFVSVRIGG